MRVESGAPQEHQGLALGKSDNAQRHQHRHRVRTQEEARPQGSDKVDLGDGDRPRGVIRNLLAGHYKGVADLRLRINFADELQAMEQSGVGSALGQPIPELEELRAQLDGLKALGDDLPPEAAEAIAEVEELAAQLSQPEGLGKDEALKLVEDLRQAFSNLLSILDEFLVAQQAAAEPPAEEPQEPAAAEPPDGGAAPEPPAVETSGEAPVEPAAPEEPPVEPVAAAEEPTEPAADPVEEPETGPDPLEVISGFLAEWQGSSLLDSLAALEQGLSAVSSLPPLSGPPDNNGAAYAKFLAIYEQLSGQAPAPAEPSDPVAEVDALV